MRDHLHRLIPGLSTVAVCGRLTPDEHGQLPLSRTLPAPPEGLRCVVVMPVRDEALGIEDALGALVVQRLHAAGVDAAAVDAFEILVLANNCSDDTAAKARAVAARHPRLRLHVLEADLPPALSNVGYVRGQLFDAACRRLLHAGHPRGFIASTDGDTRVDSDWLRATTAEIDRGADAVGGRILTDDRAGLGRRALRMQRIDAAHALLESRLASLIDPEDHDPWPRHHQHFGASLAVTATAYRAAGGMPKTEVLEDMALVQALLGIDGRLRHAPGVRVRTSSRLDGRAAVGLSWQLRQWVDADAAAAAAIGASAVVEPAVLPAPQRIALLHARRQLRGAWAAPDVAWSDLAAAARTLGIPEALLRRQLSQAPHFGALWEALRAGAAEACRQRGELVPLSQAVDGLRRAVRRLTGVRRAEAGALTGTGDHGDSSSGAAVPAASKLSSR